MMVFMVRSMWLDMGISETKREKAIKRYFDVEGEITNREDAINILLVALGRINNRLLNSIQIKGTYVYGSPNYHVVMDAKTGQTGCQRVGSNGVTRLWWFTQNLG